MALQLRRGTNAERLSITPQQGELIFVTDYLAVNITGTTITSATTITFSANHGITVLNTKLLYQGATQNGLTQGTVYYVKSTPALNQLTLSTTSGGTTLALTNGTALTLTFNKSPTNASGTPVGNVSPLWIGNGTTVGGVSAQVSVLDDLLDVTLASLQEGDTLYYDATTGQWKNTHIFKIVDDAVALDINTATNSRFTMNSGLTNNPSAPLVLRHTSTGVAGAGFGTTIGFEAETLGSGVKTIGYLDYQVIDTTTGSEDYQFGVGLMKNGVEPSPTLLRPLIIDSNGHTQITGNLTLNREKESGTDTYITFGNPTKNGVLAWNSSGSGLFINGDFDVGGTGTNGVANITAGTTTIPISIANLFNNNNIGTVNIGNGVSTEVNIGSGTGGTRTQIKSPATDLVGTLKVGGNTIKSSTLDAITLSGSDVTVVGELKVTGNKIKSSNADALTFSSSDVTVVGDLYVTGSGNVSDIVAGKTTASLFPTTPTVNIGTVVGGSTNNTAVSIGGTNSTTTINHNAVIAGDLAVNGSNSDNAWATISTTNTQAELFVQNATSVNIGYQASSLNMGATTGLTTIRNNLAVNGVNGTADITTQSYTANIYNNSGIGVVNIGNGATSQVNIGNSATGTVNIKSTSLLQNDLTGASKSFNLFNTITEQLYIGGAATTLSLGAGSGYTYVNNNLTVAQNLQLNGNTIKSGTGATAITLSGSNVTVAGDLIVNGTTTTINSTTLTVDDKNIELGSVATPSNSTATGGGITLLGGSDGNKTIVWNNATDGWELNQSIKVTGNTVTSGDLTVTGGNISLNNGTSNIIDFNGSGIASPTTTTRSAGTKLVLYPSLSSSFVDYAIGASANEIWNSVKSNSDTQSFKWYGGTTEVAKLDGVGNLQFDGNLTLGSNTIKASNGTTAIETNSTGDIIVGDDMFARGNVLQLNYGTTGTPTLGAAVQVERGDSTNVELGWNENTDRWVFTNDGTNYTNIPVAADTPTYAGLSISNNTTSTLVGITGTLANTNNDNDFWFVGGYAINGETNNGAMVIATANNGIEPIFVRQYTGGGTIQQGTIATELKLLDASGNTTIPKILTVNGGNNATAGLQTTGAISVGGNIYGYGTDGIFVNGSNLVLNNNTTGTPVNNAVIAVARGSSTNASITWNEGTDTWDFTNDVNIKGGNLSTGITNTWITVDRETSNTDASARALVLRTASSGTPTIGFGTALGFDVETSTDVFKTAAYISVNSTDVTTGSEDFSMGFGLMKDGATYADKMLLSSSGDLTTTGNLQVSGNTIKKSGGTDVITFSGTNLTTFAGDIKLMGDSIYSSTGWRMFDYRETASIYGTSYQVKMNADKNVGLSTSYVALDNIVEINTSSLTTTQNSTYAVLDYFDKTQYRSAKYLIQITNGTSHQMWEGMVIHNGTDIFVSAYGDIRTDGNLATVSVGFNETTGYAELRVTPVNATQTKFKATKTYIAV